MSILRVYLDTSVVGGCCDTEFSRWSLALFRDIRLGLLIPVISDITESELADAPPEVQAVYDELEDGVLERIEETPECITLAEKYIAEGILSEKFRADARHIAVATVNEVDVLVSWNFKHVVHHDKIRRFNAVNALCGYRPLQIFTPLEVANEEL
jgi:hypothetical protein